MELASRSVGSAWHLVEAIAPVESQKSEHGQEDTGAHTSGAIHLERVEVLETEPAVTCFQEAHGIDGSRGVKRQGITQLQGIFGEDVAAD